MRALHCKIVQSGDILEVYEYEKVPKLTNRVLKDLLDKKIKDPNRIEEYIKTSQYVSREKIRRYALTNFKKGNTFVTLTFADNITDHQEANKEFKNFILRLKRISVKTDLELKYLSVIEYQKRGSIHYHMITNFPLALIQGETEFEKNAYFTKRFWKQGFATLKDISEVDNVGAYLIKYLTKDMTTELDQHRYLKSNNLKQSISITSYGENLFEHQPLGIGEIPINLMEFKDELSENNLVYTSTYENEFWGKINYREYNLNRTYKK